MLHSAQAALFDLRGPVAIPVPEGFTIDEVGGDIILKGRKPDTAKHRNEDVTITFSLYNVTYANKAQPRLDWRCDVSSTYERQVHTYSGAPKYEHTPTGKWVKASASRRGILTMIVLMDLLHGFR